jgi:hypothetical protein
MQNISARRRADTNPHYGRGKRAQNQCFRTGRRPPVKTENPWAVTGSCRKATSRCASGAWVRSGFGPAPGLRSELLHDGLEWCEFTHVAVSSGGR